jgi:NAD(P)-dependent dehydrogenase (short-subunit alcohol dehydrogenase family)
VQTGCFKISKQLPSVLPTRVWCRGFGEGCPLNVVVPLPAGPNQSAGSSLPGEVTGPYIGWQRPTMNPPVDSLQGKVALITGAGSGLGEAIALMFAACGAKIGAVDRNENQLKRVVEEITATGGAALALPADVTAADQLAAAVTKVEETWGRLDTVCANAGINGTWAPVDELTPEEWDETLGINLKGTFLTVRACTPLLKRSGGGSIIITSSGLGTRMFAQTSASAYAASKSGQAAFGRMIALELAKHKIRVNTVCPGAFKSNIMASTRFRNTRDLRLPVLYPEGNVPLTGGPIGTVEQMARVVWFLASDLSDFVTGTEIYADGGQSLITG